MSYQNGRIYTETVGGQQVGVSIYDVQRAVPVTLRRTVNGVVERKSSSDLGVLVSAKVGDTVPASDGKGDWRVERRVEINPWARYKPIPCFLQLGRNVPRSLTPTERALEHYGVKELADNYTADDIQQWENYANTFLDANLKFSGLQMRSWENGMYKRLTDFVKTDANGQTVNGVGYDHKARFDGFVVYIVNEPYTIEPTIPENRRIMTISPDSENFRFEMPNDTRWVKIYLELALGLNGRVPTSETYIDANEEWLNAFDIYSNNTAQSLVNYSQIRRGVMFFGWNDNLNLWKYKCCVYDNMVNAENAGTRNYNEHPESFVDFNSEEQLNRPRYVESLSELEGDYLVIEYWRERLNDLTQQPIVGLAYKIKIIRTDEDIAVDVRNVLSFLRVQRDSEVDTYTTLQIHFDYDPNEFGSIPAGEEYVTVPNLVTAEMGKYYDSIVVSIPGIQQPFDLLNAIQYNTDTHGSDYDWFHGTILIYEDHYIDIPLTKATITAMRKRNGMPSAQVTKELDISQT